MNQHHYLSYNNNKIRNTIHFIFLLFLGLFLISPLHAITTHREKQFENADVSVWKTTIEPNQPLRMHRHDRKRVVVALTNVNLTVINNHGKTHKILLKRGAASFLNADKPGELHADVNASNHPMEVMVIELKK
ncbi:MAG: hypothetical protein A3F67_06930 [Verrucomicrobia bacterium RIFCSPHIGHO2_12_FULL_41_10]|nr:MAG: hypothetical protein A3F67_06930 [Verrucomicrobia bacterium RIFCSPHIGHO2_12_FULL_41_10]HLB32997.1 hypothetical protein [Chthoniobacterales bacterium]